MIDVNVSSKDIEACNQIGKSKNVSKTAIVLFANRKPAKKPFFNKKGLKISIENQQVWRNCTIYL